MLTLLLDALKGYVPVLLVVVFGAALGPGRGHAGAGRSGGVRRPPVAGVLPLPGRQGRGHRGRRAAGAEPLARARDAGHLADRRVLLPLLVARVAGGGGLRAVLPAADLGLRADGAVDDRDEPAAVWRHGANIGKLLTGTESKLGQKAAPMPHRRRRTSTPGRQQAFARRRARRAQAGAAQQHRESKR